MTRAEEVRSEKTIDEIAEERASRYAPLPKMLPLQAGMYGAVITTAPIIVFMGLARLSPDKFHWPLVITMGLGFAIPALFSWNEKRKHYNAWSREYEALIAKSSTVDDRG